MRKVVLQLMVTLDGYMAGPDGELDWIVAGGELLEKDHMAIAQAADVAIFGRNTYDAMASYWPKLADDEAASPTSREFAKVLNAMPKLVFCAEEETFEWNNTSACVVADDQAVVQKITELKAQDGKDILVYGGVKTAQTFVQQDLVDEYHLDVNPVLLGQGHLLFEGIKDRRDLTLVSTQAFGAGLVALIYRRK